MTRLELSIRENFGHPRRFGPPMLAVGDKLHNNAIAELRNRCDGERVLVLIHGYNSDVAGARAAYQDIEARVLDWYTVCVRCYWPGSRIVPGFWQAWERADNAGYQFRSILDGLPAVSIDIQGHSMAGRVWGYMFKDSPAAGPWRYAMLAGAAIPRVSLDADGGKYYRSACNFKRVLALWSRHDEALKLQRITTAGIVQPLGLRGPTSRAAANVIGLDCSDTVLDHGGYRHSDQVYDAWRALVTTGRL